MWLVRWFTRRSSPEQDSDEPARYAAPDLTRAPALSAQPVQKPARAAKKGGFDPYNSGAFQRHNTWEKVSRR